MISLKQGILVLLLVAIARPGVSVVAQIFDPSQLKGDISQMVRSMDGFMIRNLRGLSNMKSGIQIGELSSTLNQMGVSVDTAIQSRAEEILQRRRDFRQAQRAGADYSTRSLKLKNEIKVLKGLRTRIETSKISLNIVRSSQSLKELASNNRPAHIIDHLKSPANEALYGDSRKVAQLRPTTAEVFLRGAKASGTRVLKFLAKIKRIPGPSSIKMAAGAVFVGGYWYLCEAGEEQDVCQASLESAKLQYNKVAQMMRNDSKQNELQMASIEPTEQVVQ